MEAGDGDRQALAFGTLEQAARTCKKRKPLCSSKTHLLFLLTSYYSVELGKHSRILLSHAVTQLSSHLAVTRRFSKRKIIKAEVLRWKALSESMF